MNRAVAERRRKSGIHLTMLVEEGEPVELGARDRDLEVIASSRSVLDIELGGVRERMLEEYADRLGFHPRSW